MTGGNGGEFVDSSSGNVTATNGFTVLNDVVLNSITGNYDGTSVLSGVTIPAGVYVAGNFSVVDVTSGVIQVHDR